MAINPKSSGRSNLAIKICTTNPIPLTPNCSVKVQNIHLNACFLKAIMLV
jgi:hypothetical protein